jgi:anti-anti-sigma factor
VRTELRAAGTTVSAVLGDLDLEGLALVGPPLEEALAGAPGPLCLDLAGVGFCDSSGLNLLLRLRIGAERRGVPFRLAAPRPQMQRLFELTGADTVFQVFDSVEEACGAA